MNISNQAHTPQEDGGESPRTRHEVSSFAHLLPVGGKFSYSVKEVAALTSRAQSSVWEDIRQQKFPVVRIGGRVLVLATDLVNYLESLRDWSGEPRLSRGPKRKRTKPVEGVAV